MTTTTNTIKIIVSFIPYDDLDDFEKSESLPDDALAKKFNITLTKLRPFYSGEFYYEASGNKSDIEKFLSEFMYQSLDDILIEMTDTLKFYFNR